MSTQHAAIFQALAAPFEQNEVKVRSQGGRHLHYVTARTVMNRLDNVLGPENWWNSYYSGGDHSIVCTLTIRLPDGSTLTKCDAGGFAGMADQGDDDKSGYSDSLKRAAVMFGIGRYLYRDGVASLGPDQAPAAAPATAGDLVKDLANGKTEWPGKGPGSAGVPAAPDDNRAPDGRQRKHANGPETGRALFAWTKDQEQKHGVGLLKYLNGWAKLQDFPGRMVDWDADQVRLALAEAQRKLASVHSESHDSATK